MKYVQDTKEKSIFVDFYEDDPLGFLIKGTIDTEVAKEKLYKLKRKLDCVERAIRLIELNNSNDLWSRYQRGELPAIHDTGDLVQDAFKDALNIQADRILHNLQKHFINMTENEIKEICFPDIDKGSENDN